MTRIAVIGTGGWGKNHVRVLSELGVLVAVCDLDRSRSEVYAKKFGIKGYSNVDEMIRSEALDGVTIATPASTHVSVASKTLRAGINTFVEKPMTSSVQEGEELIKIAEASGKILTVGFIERFNPAISELKKLTKGGSLGRPILFQYDRENRRGDNITDVGVVKDASVHDIDTARWLFGEVVEVNCRAEANVYTNILNDFWMTLKHQSGLEVPVFSSGHASWIIPFERVEVIGDHSCIITEELNRISYTLGLDLPTQVQEFHYLPPTTSWGVEEEDRLFVDALIAKKSPPVTVDDGYKTVEIIEALYRSAKIGKPVQLPL